MKILVFLGEGFEEVEAVTVVDYLRRMEIIVDMVSITRDNIVRGSHNINVTTDKLLDELNLESYDGLVIPGGMPGALNLRDNKEVIDIVKRMYYDNKLVAAICAGPIVLAKANIIEDKNITSFPGFEKELPGANYKNDSVVVDGNIITSKGPYFAVDFAIEIVRYLLGDKKAEALKTDILYKK